MRILDLCSLKDGKHQRVDFFFASMESYFAYKILQPNNKIELYIDNQLAQQYQLSIEDMSYIIVNKKKHE